MENILGIAPTNLKQRYNMSYKNYEKHSVTYQLIEHINKMNEDGQKRMDANPNLWVGKLTNDPDHWADYGVYTPEDFERYLDNEAKHCQEKEARYANDF